MSGRLHRSRAPHRASLRSGLQSPGRPGARGSTGSPGFARQRGMVLVVVLAVMAITMLAGLGALRSADSANVVAGNFAFQRAASQASDWAVDNARDLLANLVRDGGGNVTVPDRYFAVRDTGPRDAMGLPTSIAWNRVECFDDAGAAVADCQAETGGYRVQYVVERLCVAKPDLANPNDIRANCEYETHFESNPSATPAEPSAETIRLRYRVLIRVRGPRGTERWFEALVTGPAKAV